MGIVSRVRHHTCWWLLHLGGDVIHVKNTTCLSRCSSLDRTLPLDGAEYQRHVLRSENKEVHLQDGFNSFFFTLVQKKKKLGYVLLDLIHFGFTSFKIVTNIGQVCNWYNIVFFSLSKLLVYFKYSRAIIQFWQKTWGCSFREHHSPCFVDKKH